MTSRRISTALVSGMGAAGSRHARVLRDLLPEVRLIALRREGSPVSELADVTVHDISVALEFSPDMAVLAGPAQTHIPQLRELVRADVPTLVEKPLSHDLIGVDEIIELARQRNVCVAVGYNLRSSAAVLAAHTVLSSGAIGKPWFLRAQVGQDLGTWRPGRAPSETVSVRRRTGGGALLELSHELDLALWLGGAATHVVAETRRLGAYVVDVEDFAEVIVSHRSGLVSSLHVDLIARAAHRSLVIWGELGRVECDLINGTLRVTASNGCDERQFAQNVPGSYRRQMRAFLTAIDLGTRAPVGLRAARDTLALAMAARASAESGRREPLVSFGAAEDGIGV